MRIIIFSIAFIFLAFSAQSQVLKSAGVWYFLDVDSMTARPAVLPNGTELAYVVGTKTVYYWNRNTNTWTAYGSTFNRDSIYFDSSIIGSGTLSDPWRVDSTLFATITAVGDSIAAALSYVSANYFPLQGGTLTGTGGAGFVGFPSQVSAPGTPASGLNVYAQGSSFNWKGTDGYERQFASTLTGGRTYTLPDVSGTFALGTGTTNRVPLWTATNTLGSSNIQDNNTAVSILNSKPFLPGQWTTAGRPTGVTGYEGYNTTGNGKEWYNGTRWAYALESTFARGTNTCVPYFNSFGQIINSANMTFNGSLFSVGGSITATTDIHSTSSSFDGLRSIYIRHNSDGTNVRGALYAQVGSNVNTDNTISIQSFSDSYTNSVFGGTYIAGNYLVAGTSFQPTGNTKRMHFATGVTKATTSSDTVEYVYHRFNLSSSLSSSTRFAAISNRGIQIPSTATAGRVLSKVNQYWLSYNTDSLQVNYRDNSGWHMIATRAYTRSLIPMTLYTGDGTLTSNRTITSGGFDLRYTGSFSVGSPSAPARTLHVTGAARITGSAGTATTIMGRDANGDISSLGLSGLSIISGVLTATGSADGNGIYTGSGTLSQHTTRALIPSTGNLFFSQKFNANADSAYFNIVNYLGGERAVNFGLTDTSSTGYSRGYFESDGAGSMNWTLETKDANGSTMVRALEGALSLSATAGNISLSAPVDQEVIATGMVRAKQEAYYEINSTSSPQNLSNTYSDNFINQGGTQATFTLVFPASPEDGQVLKITYNNNISTLTLDGNGNTIVGTTVTTAVKGTQRVFKFYAGDGVWIRQN